MTIKSGIYVDAENIRLCGGYGMQYNILAQCATRENAVLLKASCYIAEDYERTQTDKEFKNKLFNYYNILQKYGFKVIRRRIKKYTDENGVISVKANMDMDLTMDAITQCRNLDRIIIVTGDGDFIKPIQYIQSRGCHVTVIGFDNVNRKLQEVADLYVSGYLIADLLPIKIPVDSTENWYRGFVYSYMDKGFGFIRCPSMEQKHGTDNLFFHISNVNPDLVSIIKHPSSNVIYEFCIQRCNDNKLEAVDIRRIKI